MSLSNPVLTGPSEGRSVTYGSGSTAELKIDGEQSGGGWGVVDWHVRAGDEPPLHTHTREDETVYVVEGSITAYLGDQTIEVAAGSYAALPKGIPHGLTVNGEEAHLLVAVVPAGFEQYLVPRDGEEADPEEYGLEINGPVPSES
jgi:quercetin dioxygenase-like cupin family protein